MSTKDLRGLAEAREAKEIKEEIDTLSWYRSSTEKVLMGLFGLSPPPGYKERMERLAARLDLLSKRNH